MKVYKGSVHKVCKNGHYWKDDEIEDTECPICGGISDKSIYYDFPDDPDIPIHDVESDELEEDEA